MSRFMIRKMRDKVSVVQDNHKRMEEASSRPALGKLPPRVSQRTSRAEACQHTPAVPRRSMTVRVVVAPQSHFDLHSNLVKTQMERDEIEMALANERRIAAKKEDHYRAVEEDAAKLNVENRVWIENAHQLKASEEEHKKEVMLSSPPPSTPLHLPPPPSTSASPRLTAPRRCPHFRPAPPTVSCLTHSL